MNICAGNRPATGLPAPRVGGLAPLLLALVLAACASPPPPPPPAPAPAPARPSLAELMKDAQDAHSQGAKERARETLREATRSYPTSKEPWQKLAEDHFAAADYGYAVLAAQEVSQRDPADRTAHSILAVAGLRVAAMALGALRGQHSGMPADTRSEAETLTKLLRETLGEQVLVPQPEATTQALRRAPAKRATAAAAVKPAEARPADAKLAELAGKPASAKPEAPKPEPAKPEAAKAEANKPAAKPAAPQPVAASPAANPFDRLR